MARPPRLGDLGSVLLFHITEKFVSKAKGKRGNTPWNNVSRIINSNKLRNIILFCDTNPRHTSEGILVMQE